MQCLIEKNLKFCPLLILCGYRRDIRAETWTNSLSLKSYRISFGYFSIITLTTTCIYPPPAIALIVEKAGLALSEWPTITEKNIYLFKSVWRWFKPVCFFYYLLVEITIDATVCEHVLFQQLKEISPITLEYETSLV